MRREMRYAIAVGVFILGAGAWFFNSMGPRIEPSASELNIGESADSMTASSETTETTAPSASENRADTAASPVPIGAPANQERSSRPGSIEVATPAVPAQERTGLASASLTDGPDQTALPAPVEPAPAAAAPAPSVEAAPVQGPAEQSPITIAVIKPEKPAAITVTPSDEKVYTIKSGDNFSTLAAKHLGSAKHAKLIAAANPKVDPRKLHVGAKILIPPVPASAATKPAAEIASAKNADKPTKLSISKSAAPAAPAIPADRSYTVKPGESWDTLGQRFLGSAARGVELYELNKERVPRNLSRLPANTVIELPAEAAGRK